MVYLNELPKWVINVETFGIGDGSLLKIWIFDIKNNDSEELLLQRTLNNSYTALSYQNSSTLFSEERFHLFRASYGLSPSKIDFSTYKFRFHPPTSLLLLRTTSPIQFYPLSFPPSTPTFTLSLYPSYLSLTLQTFAHSFTLSHPLSLPPSSLPTLSKELSLFTSSIKVVEISPNNFEVQPLLQEEEGSWEESSNLSIKEVLPPNELLKARYPEVGMKVLKGSEGERRMVVISRRIYEVDVYFLRNVERSRRDLVRFIEKQRLGEWDFIYVEMTSKASKEYYRLILMESQIMKVLQWADLGVEMVVEGRRREIADVVVKALNIENEEGAHLMVSEEKYRQRDVLEGLSEIEVKMVGRYLKEVDTYDEGRKKGDELLIDFSNKLILSTETEFSTGFYDIKIFERTFREKTSYRFELALAPPRVSDTFVVDFECKVKNRMNRVLIETISLEENNADSSESHSIVFTSSLVLAIFENSFPHYVEFTLMEPSTKAEWSHV